jgi:hypothetical protein
MSLLVRIWTRALRHKLDRELATGADPNANDLTRERSRQLLTEENRRSLAARLRALMEDADSEPRLFSSRVPIARQAIRDSRWDLEEVIERLTTPTYLCPQGIARLSLLLEEGTSPLFGPATPPRQLRWSLLSAAEGMDHGPILVAS